MTKTIRAADAVARRLYAAGCRMAFGMPGGEVLTMVDALEAAGIRFVLCKHENAAAFMAEGTWHRTGAPGVLVATVGPGVLNGVNAVANALQDRVPLIVLAGAVDADEAQSYTHQVLDQCAVFAPITKATFLLDAGAVHVIADKAVGIATEGQPGPVFIDIPIRVAEAQVPAIAPTPRAVAADVVPDATTLQQIAGWLSQAARPVIVAGVDALNDGADVAGLARRFGVPVVTTYKAKGLLPEDDALSMGGAGLSPLADKTLLPLVQSADLVLCLGGGEPPLYAPVHGQRRGICARDGCRPDARRHPAHDVGGRRRGRSADRIGQGVPDGRRLGPRRHHRHLPHCPAPRHAGNGGQRRAPHSAQPDVAVLRAARTDAIVGAVHHGLRCAVGDGRGAGVAGPYGGQL